MVWLLMTAHFVNKFGIISKIALFRCPNVSELSYR